ncbi:hypothetical protein [Paenarthrobacter nicotinovorans]|uniref:hypothetical protein n=1 Tax=Paenarthrobacter nicotinovorans TaxID=29320 RepID=UPI00047CA2B6|nr:hypothetical protein [Paenarthrobacter nicotinovorans]
MQFSHARIVSVPDAAGGFALWKSLIAAGRNWLRLEHAVMLRDNKGASMREIMDKTGPKRTTLYRHMLLRPS